MSEKMKVKKGEHPKRPAVLGVVAGPRVKPVAATEVGSEFVSRWGRKLKVLEVISKSVTISVERSVRLRGQEESRMEAREVIVPTGVWPSYIKPYLDDDK